jgi:hypothetical protein
MEKEELQAALEEAESTLENEEDSASRLACMESRALWWLRLKSTKQTNISLWVLSTIITIIIPQNILLCICIEVLLLIKSQENKYCTKS